MMAQTTELLDFSGERESVFICGALERLQAGD